MGQFTELCGRLLDATEAGDLLAAALEAFCLALDASHAHHDPADPMFTAFVMAGIQAAEGRDAVAFAPSLPSGVSIPSDNAAGRASSERAPSAAEVAGLCMLLAARLQQLAANALLAADRRACADGARSARSIHQLLTGHAPA
jgi:hypothetical protein